MDSETVRGASSQHRALSALPKAFPHTLPVMAGYLLLSMTLGLVTHTYGLPFQYPLSMAVVIYGGSVEFLVANMMLGAFDPLQAFVVAFVVNARHLFYGLSMLPRYRGVGKKKPYLIYALSDETFSVNCSVEVPQGVDHGWFYYWVTFLDQLYWVTGATVGNLFGNLLTFDTRGLDFAMTAMFVAIFVDNFLREDWHASSFLGLGITLVCLAVFGPKSFIVPSMLAILAVLTLLRPKTTSEAGA